jgi:hypothetical protein
MSLQARIFWGGAHPPPPPPQIFIHPPERKYENAPLCQCNMVKPFNYIWLHIHGDSINYILLDQNCQIITQNKKAK